jgi:pre-mRNA-splicing factor 38B
LTFASTVGLTLLFAIGVTSFLSPASLLFASSLHFTSQTEATKTPSTCFCLLLRLLTLRCTEKQMTTMLSHHDSPYIRCIGFLYLRFASSPHELYAWCQPFLYDEEKVTLTAKGQDKATMTIGEYVRELLLTNLSYFGTRLPRLPVTVERDIQTNLQLEEEKEARAQHHLALTSTNKQQQPNVELFQEGMHIRGLYGDEENPVTWYPCIIGRIILRDEESGTLLPRPRYKVTFTEYGNTEVLTLGEIDFLEGSANAVSSASASHPLPYSAASAGARSSRHRDDYDRADGREGSGRHRQGDRDLRGSRSRSNDRGGQEERRHGHHHDSNRRGYGDRDRGDRYKKDGSYQSRDRDRAHTHSGRDNHHGTNHRGYGGNNSSSTANNYNSSRGYSKDERTTSTSKYDVAKGSAKEEEESGQKRPSSNNHEQEHNRTSQDAAAKKQKLLSRYG